MTTDATLTRSARAEQTRARIVAAARDVFVTQGYRASSLRDVATAAGLSHPGLLKHFATKDLVLAEVVGAFERANEEAFLEELETYAAGSLAYASVAARNEQIPGYLPLYAALVGEGSTPGHPAHGWMRDRYARLREMSTDALRGFARKFGLPPDHPIHRELRDRAPFKPGAIWPDPVDLRGVA